MEDTPLAIKAITFDVYSALYDTVTGLTAALDALFRRRGLRDDPAAAARLWRLKHMEYLLIANSLDREPAGNRRALEASMRSVLRRVTPPLTPEEVAGLVGAWETLPPWPEAAGVLVAVRRRTTLLGTLSNGDADMLRLLLRNMPVAFDHIISTEGGRFKPHPSVYAKALRALDVRPDELVHIAGSATDAAGATAFGIQTIWVNRAGDAVADPRYAPAHDVRDLNEALRVIEDLLMESGTGDPSTR